MSERSAKHCDPETLAAQEGDSVDIATNSSAGSQGQRRVLLRTSRFFHCMVLGLVIAPVILSAILLLTGEWRTEPLAAVIILNGFFLLMAGAGAVGVRHFGDTVELDEAGISYTGPGGRRRSLQWAELAEVRARSDWAWLLISRTGGRKAAISVDRGIFQHSRVLFDVLFWAWWQTRKEAFGNLTLPRSFRASRARGAILVSLVVLFFGGFGVGAACVGEWLPAAGFLALGAVSGVGCARDFVVEVSIGTDGVEYRYGIGRPRFLPMSEIKAVELGYDALPRIVFRNGKRRFLRTAAQPDALEVYATAFHAWERWHKAAPKQAPQAEAQGHEGPAPSGAGT